MVDDGSDLGTARDAAKAAVRSAREIEEFLNRLAKPAVLAGPAEPAVLARPAEPAVLARPAEPAMLAEYAFLLARDEQARAARGEAFDALGLRAPSIEEPTGTPGEGERA